MTTRRSFIQGGFAVLASAAVPGGDGVVLDSSAHPYNYRTYNTGFAISRQSLEESYIDIGARLHAALARSMMQTKEHVAVRVFREFEDDFLRIEGISAEEFYADD